MISVIASHPPPPPLAELLEAAISHEEYIMTREIEALAVGWAEVVALNTCSIIHSLIVEFPGEMPAGCLRRVLTFVTTFPVFLQGAR